ncbi:MAG: hypothetical protein WC334_02970 [Kiritimatiellales bacterium]
MTCAFIALAKAGELACLRYQKLRLLTCSRIRAKAAIVASASLVPGPTADSWNPSIILPSTASRLRKLILTVELNNPETDVLAFVKTSSQRAKNSLSPILDKGIASISAFPFPSQNSSKPPLTINADEKTSLDAGLPLLLNCFTSAEVKSFIAPRVFPFCATFQI